MISVTRVRTLAEMKDKYIGKVGSKERDDYEYELRMDVLMTLVGYRKKISIINNINK